MSKWANWFNWLYSVWKKITFSHLFRTPITVLQNVIVSFWAHKKKKITKYEDFQNKTHKIMVYLYLYLNHYVFLFTYRIRSLMVYEAVKIWDMGGCESAWNIVVISWRCAQITRHSGQLTEERVLLICFFVSYWRFGNKFSSRTYVIKYKY